MRPAGFDAGPALSRCCSTSTAARTRSTATSFFDEFQVYAGAGYAVVYTNPRGSQGYGEAFTRAVVGDWGGGDYADVHGRRSTRRSRRYAWIDPDAAGRAGRQLRRLPDQLDRGPHRPLQGRLLRARGELPRTRMFGTSDIGHLFNVVRAGRRAAVGGHGEGTSSARRSPTPRTSTTPLLIIHSEDDLRCPIEQGEQLFVALKKLRREVVLRALPGREPRALALGQAAPPARALPDHPGLVREVPLEVGGGLGAGPLRTSPKMGLRRQSRRSNGG